MVLEHLEERSEGASIVARTPRPVGIPTTSRVSKPELLLVDIPTWIVPALRRIVVQHPPLLVDPDTRVYLFLQLKGFRQLKCFPGGAQRLANLIVLSERDGINDRIQ